MSTSRRLAAQAAAFAAVAVVLPGGSAVAGANTFNGNLCAIASKGALKTLQVTGSCVGGKPVVDSKSTPLGSIRTVTYQARWGSYGSLTAPGYEASVEVVYFHGAVPAVAYLQKLFRSQVLSNGAPFSASPLASEFGDTASCTNPPIDDCNKGSIMALVDQYVVIMDYYGPARFVAADNPQQPSVDDKNDVAQEDAIKAPFDALAKSIVTAL